jgi:hypothetical protein
MTPFVRRASEIDVEYLARDLRKEDAAEIKAAVGLSPIEGLMQSFRTSHRVWVAVDEEGPWAMFGVGGKDHIVGHPWMLAADRMKRHAKTFIQQCPKWIEEMSKGVAILQNFVDARNTVHIRWLKWAGFTFADKPVIAGVERRPFFEFYKSCVPQH